MKTKTIITEITHDDLVNLLSTASYGSSWLGLNYDSTEYHELPNKDEGDCIEDKMAKLLLAGCSVELYDMYAEDNSDFYGKLPHYWDADNRTMDYEVRLEDIKKGLQKAFKDKYASKYARDLACEGDDFDFIEADALIQFILFGEVIYG